MSRSVLENLNPLDFEKQPQWGQPRARQSGSRPKLLAGHTGEPLLPTTFMDFDETSREDHLSTIQTVLQTHTRIADLYANALDQLREKVRVTIEAVKERELINDPDFGLLHEVVPAKRVPTRSDPPTPDDLDDLDDLLTKVWTGSATLSSSPTRVPSPPSGARGHGAACRRWSSISCSASADGQTDLHT